MQGTLLLVAMVDETAAEAGILPLVCNIKQGMGSQQEETVITSKLVCRTLEREIPWTISMVVVGHHRAQVIAADQGAYRVMGGSSAKISSMDPLRVTVPPPIGMRQRQRSTRALFPWASK